RLGVHRFSDGAADLDRGQVVVRRDALREPAHQRTDQGRSGVVAGHPVAFDDLEVASRVRGIRYAFVDDLGDAVGQRTVHLVGVRGDPGQVRGAPVHVV